MKAHRLVLVGSLIGLGAVLHVVEGLVPMPIAVPGAKLGLANAATLLALALEGPWAAVAVAVTRPLVGGLFGGGLFSMGFVLSLSGAMTSALVMVALWPLVKPHNPRRLSLIGISLAGGVAHNLGQLAVAVYYVGLGAALAYLGPLLIAGLVAGYLVGRLSSLVAGATSVRFAFGRLTASSKAMSA